MHSTIILTITAQEARHLITDIRAHLSHVERHGEQARQKALRLYQTEAWRMLGYVSFRACAEAEFGRSWQQVYRLVDAAQVDANLAQVSPTGEIPLIAETHARELKRLVSPQAQYAAVERAKTLAQTEGAIEPTARHIAQAVAVEEASQIAQKNVLIHHLIVNGDITAKQGAKLLEQVERHSPRIRGDLLQLIAKHNLKDPQLIAPIGDMLKRQGTLKESKVLPEVLRGYLGGTPLAHANLSDLKRANVEARLEHVAEAQEQERQARVAAGQTVIEVVPVNVYKGDVERTVKALISALEDNVELEQVFRGLAQHLGWKHPLSGQDDGFVVDVLAKITTEGGHLQQETVSVEKGIAL